jgi:hypothetical protein
MSHTAERLKMFDGFFRSKSRYRALEDNELDGLAEELPEVLIALLRRDGLCSYNDGLLWTCDPNEWAPLCKPWFPKGKNSKVVMRTALGEPYIWDGDLVWKGLVHEARTTYAAPGLDIFISSYLTQSSLYRSTGLGSALKKGLRQAGPLAFDEMYFWVPALLLGGDPATSKLEKGKASVALEILAQQAEITIDESD